LRSPKLRIANAQIGFCAGAALYFAFLTWAWSHPPDTPFTGSIVCTFGVPRFSWYAVVAHARLGHLRQTLWLSLASVCGAAMFLFLVRPLRKEPIARPLHWAILATFLGVVAINTWFLFENVDLRTLYR
jgi:hypothetical protein